MSQARAPPGAVSHGPAWPKARTATAATLVDNPDKNRVCDMNPASLQRSSEIPDHGARAEEPVLVFESNLGGQHVRGVSLLAEKCHGAVDGKGWGHHGNAYGIPTLDSEMMPLTRGVLTNYIQGFLKYAAAHPQLQFRVTAFGYGNPNIGMGEIVEMFRQAPRNCLLPGRWMATLGRLDVVRLLLLDASGSMRETAAQDRLDEYFAINAPLWSEKPVEIVSVGAAVSVVANDRYARRRNHRHRIISVREDFYRNYLNQAREEMAVWYSTRMVTVLEPDQTSQGNMLRLLQAATRAGLEMDEIQIGD
ncbi:MAG: hypothetical protein NFCOHLIN_01773 [Gammaproteobacteria bacterium]|nr:hypothetical protein [Gammaproteobacteria bacterium]